MLHVVFISLFAITNVISKKKNMILKVDHMNTLGIRNASIFISKHVRCLLNTVGVCVWNISIKLSR